MTNPLFAATISKPGFDVTKAKGDNNLCFFSGLNQENLIIGKTNLHFSTLELDIISKKGFLFISGTKDLQMNKGLSSDVKIV